MNDSLCD
ncbi:hypothetical protein D047_3624A, partial [Vibrio parahaemolyticus VPTS-2010_2]